MLRVLRRPLPLVLVCLAVIAVLGVLVRGSNAITRFDADVVDEIAGDRGPTVVDVARVITDLGDVRWLALLLLAVVIGLWRSRILTPGAATAPLLSLAAGAVLAPAIKAVVGRPRPPAALHEVVERSSGFPSGHSTQSAAGWFALGLVLALAGRGRPALPTALVRRWPLVAAVTLFVLVGTSRVVLGVHSPTDVLAGWLLGLSCAVTVVGLLLRGSTAGR